MAMRSKERAILLVGSGSDCLDIEYVTGFRAPDPVVFLWTAAGSYLVVHQLEAGRAQRTAAARLSGRRGLEVLTPESLGLRGKRQKRSLSGWALAVLRRAGVRTVRVPSTFPHGVAKRLERAGVRTQVSAVALFPGRAVKTMEEQKYIRESQQAAVIAMRAATAMIAESEIGEDGYLLRDGRVLTSEAVRDVVTRALLDRNCFSRDTIVAGGIQGADPHERGTGPLRGHEPIVIDIFPQHQDHGYWGDLTRTVVKGSAPAPVRRVYQAVKAAQQAALAVIRPAVKCATVHAAAVAEFRARGFETREVDGRWEGFIHGTGHGVGLAVHEAPSVSASDTRLRSGHVITVEPGLYSRACGGVRIEDTVVVTASGWRHLVPCEKVLEV